MKNKYTLSIQDDEDHPITEKTKAFLISLFVSMRYEKEEDLDYFLNNELNLQKTECYDDKFVKNGNNYIDFGACCGGGTFQKTIVLPVVLKSKEDALSWINEKIKESQSLSFSDLSEGVLSMIDAETFEEKYNKEYEEYTEKELKRKKITEKIKEDEHVFYRDLKEKLIDEFKEKDIVEELLRNKMKN